MTEVSRIDVEDLRKKRAMSDVVERCRADIIVGDADEQNTNEYTCDLPVGHEDWHKSYIYNASWTVESDE